MNFSADLNGRCPYAAQPELDWLRNWADNHANQVAVIIGAGPGVMPIAMLESPSDFDLYVAEIDTFNWLIAHCAQGNIDRLTRLTMLPGDSSEIGLAWRGGWIDLLVVDGDHSYEGVCRDIEAWVPLLSPSGIIAFHDYTRDDPPHAGIKIAIEEKLPAKYVLSGIFSSMAIFARKH